jgi:hypothetical protein
MRLVDFCNPHFKDEHSSHAWIPTLFTPENWAISRHPVRFARLDHEREGALYHHPTEGAEALTPPVVRQRVEQKLYTPPNQDRFHQQPVKAEGFPRPETPFTSKWSSTDPFPTLRRQTTGF